MPSGVSTRLPLFLDLSGRPVLVIGAGVVAEAKLAELLLCGAPVTVVAPSATARVQAWAAGGRLVHHARPFEEADLDGKWLVVAATGDRQVNASVAEASERRRVWVNAVDDPPNASAFFGSIVRREPFTIAISSAGEAPALSRLVREIVESALPEARFVEAARALRRRWRADGTPIEHRFGELFRAIADRLAEDRDRP